MQNVEMPDIPHDELKDDCFYLCAYNDSETMKSETFLVYLYVNKKSSEREMIAFKNHVNIFKYDNFKSSTKFFNLNNIVFDFDAEHIQPASKENWFRGNLCMFEDGSYGIMNILMQDTNMSCEVIRITDSDELSVNKSEIVGIVKHYQILIGVGDNKKNIFDRNKKNIAEANITSLRIHLP